METKRRAEEGILAVSSVAKEVMDCHKFIKGRVKVKAREDMEEFVEKIKRREDKIETIDDCGGKERVTSARMVN